MQNDKITKKEIIKNMDEHISEIGKEFKSGFKLLEKYQKSVTIFGSARLTKESSHYVDAENLSKQIVEETRYAILTGGGPGIMEASNKGAIEASGQSVGMNIKLPNEQHINKYVTDSIHLDYFFVRKSLMFFSSECFVFFPGGFGTFDELFGTLTLIQTRKIPHVPVILFGSDFWNPVKNLIEDQMLKKHSTISPKDMELFIITDSKDEVIRIIKDAPVSKWWNVID
jgi:hypothetical protein